MIPDSAASFDVESVRLAVAQSLLDLYENDSLDSPVYADRVHLHLTQAHTAASKTWAQDLVVFRDTLAQAWNTDTTGE